MLELLLEPPIGSSTNAIELAPKLMPSCRAHLDLMKVPVSEAAIVCAGKGRMVDEDRSSWLAIELPSARARAGLVEQCVVHEVMNK